MTYGIMPTHVPGQQCEETLEQARERLRFEELLGDVLPRFVALPAERIDAAIIETQGKLVESLGMDRSVLFSLMDDGSVAITHSWHRPDVPPAQLGLSATKFLPWCLAKVQRGEEVLFSSVGDLPPDAAADVPTIAGDGPRSCAAIPMRIGERLLGVLTFETIRSERDWPETDLKRFRLVASIFASALSRKHAAETVRAGEMRLGLAADSANLGLWTLDPDGKIWATPKAYQIYEVPPGTPVDLRFFLNVVHAGDRQLVSDAIARAMADGTDFSAEYRINVPDGSVRWIYARGRRQPRSPTGGGQLMGVSIDVTQRKSLEEELKRSLWEIRQLKDRLEAESDYLNQEIRLAHGHERIVGQSAALRRALAQVELVAPASTTVLLVGETGTGKELFASAIHDRSRRCDRPMIRVNCGAIPAPLIESELFGREKGAYTGALSKQVGRFELASGSTLFLDEIGELPLDLQVRLLRVLEEKKVERLGSPRAIAVDFRLVAATNRDLEKAVAEGKFREDLYYRLNVFQIRVPALRERREDVPLLVRAFVGEFARAQGKQFDSIDQKSMEALRQYDWPGNVRELRNVIERAVINATGTKLKIEAPTRRRAEASNGHSLRMDDVERAHLKAVLEKTGWRIRGRGGAAELLGLKPTTLESRMEKLGIVRPS